MKTKLEMAHEYAVAMLRAGVTKESATEFAQTAFILVDAMQAEADKREKEDKNEHVFEIINWQPDWSQAPKNMNYFFVNKDGSKFWTINEPDKPNLTEHVMNFSDCGGDCYAYASSQDYQGDWRNSLRKRPQ